MGFGICKLCGFEKELKKSHVVGRGVFKKALNGSNYYITFDKQEKKSIKVQDQWATHMLCGGCEHELNIKYEDYALKVLRNNLKSVKHKIRENYFEIQGVNQEKLMLYLLSILWRAIESEHPIFNRLNILSEPSTLKELIKWCVKNNKIVRTECYDIRISKLVNNIGFEIGEINFITNFSFLFDGENRIRCFIVFEGYVFEFFFLTDLSQKIDGLGVLKKNKRILKMHYIDVFSIPQIKDEVLKIINSKKRE